MEIAEIATLAFVVGTVSYRTVKHYRTVRRWQKFLEADRSVALTFDLPDEATDGDKHVAVLAFTSRGELIKKIPQAEVTMGRRRKCRMHCLVPNEAETICLLVGTRDFCISGISTYLEARQFRKAGVHLWYAERDVLPAAFSRQKDKLPSSRAEDKLSFELRKLPT